MDRKVSVRRRKFNKPWTERCKDYLRNFLAFMFSNVGIIGLVVGYTVAGAFIFIEIEEQTSNKMIRKNVTEARLNKIFNIWKISDKYNTLDEYAWRIQVKEELLEYQNYVVRAVKNGYDCSNETEEIKGWSFPGAFLYSLTVITTIGYGNVVPKTNLGKVTTIIYAIVGMPLFLLYLSNIGDIMARSFKWLYSKVCLCRCCPGVARKREERQRRRAADLKVQYLSNLDDNEDGEVTIEQSVEQPNLEENNDGSENGSDATTEALYDPQAVTVPVTVCLLIIVGYILCGTFLFKKYEEEWTILEAAYFCFISLSTIGFGDFVPGKSIYSDSVFKLSSILGSMYLMVGMALIAMCFNLMQEEVMNKIRVVATIVKTIFRCNR